MTPDEMMKVLELTGDVKKNKGTILGKLNEQSRMSSISSTNE